MWGMRTIRRTFWPVGQGAFYSETFINHRYPEGTVVYDCGVSGDTAPILGCIHEQQRKYGDDINLLFISHFHADHISHIPYLLANYNVKAIVLPVISQAAAIEVYLNNYVEATTLNSESIHFIEKLFINDPEVDETKVIFVEQLSEGNEKPHEDGSVLNITGRDFGSLQQRTTIKSETVLRFYDWEYILCNYPSAKSSALVDEMKKRYPDLLDAMMKRNWVKVRALLTKIPFGDIAKLYKDCFPNDENEESMTILSRPVDDDYTPATCCLYTGDSPFRNKERLKYVKNYYSKDWGHIGTMQAPHHGADDDNPADLHDEHRTCVACYGTGNSYGHPGKHALMNMAVSRSNIRLVNEEWGSMFTQRIEY